MYYVWIQITELISYVVQIYLNYYKISEGLNIIWIKLD
jgi:hypothetical protein